MTEPPSPLRMLLSRHTKRREFITLLGGAAVAWPVMALAQQPPVPVVGFLRDSTAEGSAHLVAGLRRGLSETGYVEGQNVAIEYRWGEGHPERLRAMAADLVQRQVSVIVGSPLTGALAAKEATSTIPIVFLTTFDPVQAGLVASLNRPGGNATGVTYLASAIGGKRLEFLHQIVPVAKTMGVLIRPRPDYAATDQILRDLQAGAAALGLQLIVSSVSHERNLDDAFAMLARQRPGGLVVGADQLFTAWRAQIVERAARHELPAIYPTADYVRVGGLMSWGVSLIDQYRVAGTYVGKILNRAKPSDLPVLQPTKYELVINLKTAKALGLQIPDKLLALADEVIE